MRRFIEEIKVQDPMIAEKIVKALETRGEDKNSPVYEVDMFEGTKIVDPCSGRNVTEKNCSVLKIFVREEVTETSKPVGF